MFLLKSMTKLEDLTVLIELYKQETEIRCRKDDGNIKK